MKPRILFVCIENSCRSQMAEGFAKKLGKDKIEVFSAGSNPSENVNEKAIEVMKEVNIYISSQKSKGFKELPYGEFDYVVTMGCGDVCPFVPAKQRIAWNIPDPKGRSIEEFRVVRDEIGKKVKELMELITE